jgi:hypothetical protein
MTTTRPLGQRLIEAGKITDDDLLQVLAEQAGTDVTFGQLAVDMGLVSMADVLEVVLDQRRDDMGTGRIGDLAVDAGYATRSQVGRAVAIQRRSGGLLGQILVDEHLLTVDELYELVEAQRRTEN